MRLMLFLLLLKNPPLQFAAQYFYNIFIAGNLLNLALVFNTENVFYNDSN